VKSINAKKIAAVTAGAALLGLGLAFASPVTFQSVPIINNAGAPQVQIVVGSSAKPSDGVAAANIAAAIGNLAFTSVPVTASVNATQAASVLHIAVSGASYSLVNPQVWLNESGTAIASGTYGFQALIGSVLNRGVKSTSQNYQNTKSLSSGTTGSAYPENSVVSGAYSAGNIYPSPFTNVANGVPFNDTLSAGTNAGGVTAFSSTFTSNGYDNILRVAPTNMNGLLNSVGTYKESENLWVTGFPVYSQASKSFTLLNTGGAYQIVFGSPIPTTISGSINNAAFTMLGQNYSIISYNGMQSGTVPSVTGTLSAVGDVVSGGKLQLASTLTGLQTVYVGHNISAGNFTVELQDLSYPNGTPAAIGVYYNHVLTNETSIPRNSPAQEFNVSGHTLYVKVGQTFAGLYAYQKWAKIQLYSNVVNLTSSSAFNSKNKGWDVLLTWANASGTGTKVDGLQGITIYNVSPTTNLMPGQSFYFINSPQMYKVTFVGDTLGAVPSANYDPLSFGLTSTSLVYQGSNIGNKNVTEPVQELTVSSSIPNAFSYGGTSSSSATFLLAPYEFTQTTNTPSVNDISMTASLGSNSRFYNYIKNNPVYVNVYGYNGANPVKTTFEVQASGTYPTLTVTPAVSTSAYTSVNSINVTTKTAFPDLTLTVNSITPSSNTLATLAPGTSGVLYTSSGLNEIGSSSVQYNQQNGGNIQTITLASITPSVTSGVGQYFNVVVPETAVSSPTYTDALGFGIDNNSNPSSTGTIFNLNYTVGSASNGGIGNNVTYYPAVQGTGYSTSNAIRAPNGFRTERGSEVVLPSGGTSLTFQIAKSIDMLQFAVAPSTSTITKSVKTYGPYGIGQATNIPNVTVANITAGVQVSGSSHYTITGISNITATPSVLTADQPVLLSSLPTAPLVVLDSNANPASNLILVGSGYVNTLSAQLQKAYNISMTPTTQIDQAYGTNRILIAGYYANQTTAAANAFIQQLYAKAASS
jgi:hypothetical protein